MFRKKAFLTTALLMIPLAATASAPAAADQYVCVPAKLIECDPEFDCGPPLPELPPPTFLHVDLDERVITVLGPAERRGETTEILFLERDGDRAIMGGLQGDRPWSIIFPEGGGEMTLTANLGDAGWVGFGRCMAADHLAP